MHTRYFTAIAALSIGASAAPAAINEHTPRLISLDLNHGKSSHKSNGPFQFTSTYNIVATPEQVVNTQNVFTGGLAGAKGYFNFGINSHEDVICYNITLVNFRGDYESLAKTATHIHQSEPGKSGPPRIAFPNPEVWDDGHGGNIRRSIGCLKGPFETGIKNNGVDTGAGFTVKQIEENPTAFNADTHSSEAVPGAVRGQFEKGKKC